jgi:hypothetical protein
MRIIDLTPAYKKFILEDNDFGSYQKAFPALFQHYYKYWTSRKSFPATISPEKISIRRNLLLKRLVVIEKKFKKFGYNLSNFKIVIFIGQNTSNGHAFKYKNEFIVWLPLETYSTKKEIDIFVTHEIIHALHYSVSPEFYFGNLKEKRNLSRQLITEGIATLYTQKILNVDERNALWADFLRLEKYFLWLKKCKNQEHELLKYIYKNFQSTNKNIEIFYANDPKNVFKYRSGYYIGLKLVRPLSTKYGDKELLKIRRKKIEKEIKDRILSLL